MRRASTWLAAAGGVLVLLLGAGAVWLCRSLPQRSGTVSVPGLTAPLEIVRDAHAVPHIFARSEPDAYFGLGYAHAQDRLWQLELNRRIGRGALAEVLGNDALQHDRLVRTLGLYRVARRNVDGLDDTTRAALRAYTRGINAWLEGATALPPEFGLLRVRPTAWSEADALVFLKVLALQLSTNWHSELLRVSLSRRLPAAAIAQLLGSFPPTSPELRGLYGALEPLAHGLLRRTLPRHHNALGSNNWAVSGARSASGAPLLANDPHLELSAPSSWYLAHLHAPGLNVIGATLPGLPGVILGRNDRVAWAFTNTRADVQDLYLERIDPLDPGAYLTPDGRGPFETRSERIAVKGAADEVLQIRSTRHGPVISDVDEHARGLTPAGHVLALRFTALNDDDHTLEFPIHAAHASDVHALTRAAERFHAPPQNIVSADRSGNIAFVAAGRVPLRAADNELRGLTPAPGWLGRYDWQGIIPFAQLPALNNPPLGRIVTANQDITPDGYPHFLSADFAAPDRAGRIGALLDARPSHTLDSFARIQRDVFSPAAERLLPLLERIPAHDAAEAEALRRLRSWNREMTAGAAEPLLFAAWLRETSRLVFGDEAREALPELWNDLPGKLADALSAAAEPSAALPARHLSAPAEPAHASPVPIGAADAGPASAAQPDFCDDRRTQTHESCASMAARGLRQALRELERRGQGGGATRWDTLHTALFKHLPFGDVPLLRTLFDVELPSAGGIDTVNLGEYFMDDETAPFTARSGPALRALYDLGDPERSRFVLGTGQSGHPLDPHYRDLSEMWRRGELIPMVTTRAAIERGALGTLRLSPQAAASPPRGEP